MLLELRFSIWTLGLGAGTFVAALYGMNLKNFIEESDAGFIGVSVICGVASVFVLMYGLNRLRRVQRVSMWGSHHQPALPSLRQPARELREMRAEIMADEKARKAAEAAREHIMNRHQHQQHALGPLWAKTKQTDKVAGTESRQPINSKPIMN
jgi:hypothetical protein